MSGNARDTGRTTLDRLFSLLDVFDGHDLTLGEVAERSGLPVSTAHRMLAALSEWGGIERSPAGLYRVGMHLWEVGLTAHLPTTLQTVALPFMQELYERTHENVQLAVRERRSVLVIDKISGTRSVRTVTQTGGRLPLHATGVGKAILAHSGGDALEELSRLGLARFTPFTLAMPGRLAESLSRARDTGVARVAEEMTLGASSVAAPVFGASGEVRAAIGVVSHTRLDLGPHTRALREAADEIGRRWAELDERDPAE